MESRARRSGRLPGPGVSYRTAPHPLAYRRPLRWSSGRMSNPPACRSTARGSRHSWLVVKQGPTSRPKAVVVRIVFSSRCHHNRSRHFVASSRRILTRFAEIHPGSPPALLPGRGDPAFGTREKLPYFARQKWPTTHDQLGGVLPPGKCSVQACPVHPRSRIACAGGQFLLRPQHVTRPWRG
jgi:hypothetical protein